MNEKWFALSLAEIEAKLKTNAAQGLNRKAARSRYLKADRGLFSFSKKPYLSLLGEILSDFALVILLILSLSSIFFEEYATGIVTTLLTMAGIILASLVCYRAESFYDKAERAFAPSCKVIRQGKLYEVRGDRLVIGDIILIDEGDILCCDARLITSEDLLVKMRVDKDRYTVLEKLAEGHVQKGEHDVSKHINTVHAGSTVLRGAARAVVTATGRFTYIGAKVGAIFSASPRKDKIPYSVSLVKKYASKISLFLLLASLPISFISILFGRDSLSLFGAFMTSVSIAVCCMAQFVPNLFRIFLAIPMGRCISSKRAICVRNTDAFDSLVRSNHLFFLDGGAFTDGIAHFDFAYCIDGYAKSSDLSFTPSAKKLSELASLYESAQNMGLSTGRSSRARYSDGILDFIKATGCDRDALKIRCSVKGFASGNNDEPYDKVFFSDLGEEYMICVSEDESLIHRCSHMMLDTKSVIFAPDKRADVLKEYRGSILEGKTPIIFAISRHKGYGVTDELCFAGTVVFSETLDRNARKCLDELHRRNVKTVFFKNITVNGSAVKVSPIPDEIIGDKLVRASDFIRSGKPMAYGLGKIGSYGDLSDTQVCELINLLKKNGESVTVVGSSEKFERIYRTADTVISALPDTMLSERLFEDIENTEEKELSSLSVSQTLKCRSDIAIQRPTANKGGLLALCSLFAASNTAYSNISYFFKYLVSIQAVRIAFVLFPMLFGNPTLDARHILFGGIILDMIALLGFAFEKEERLFRKSSREILTAPLSSCSGILCCFVGCSLFALLLPELISLLPSLSAYIDRTEYSFICLTLLNISLLLGMKLWNFRKFALRKGNRAFVVASFCVVVLLALIYIVPYFSVWFGIEGFFAPIYLVVAFIPPIISFILGILFGDSRLKKKR